MVLQVVSTDNLPVFLFLANFVSFAFCKWCHHRGIMRQCLQVTLVVLLIQNDMSVCTVPFSIF